MKRPEPVTKEYAELTLAGLRGALALIEELRIVRRGDPLVVAVADSLRHSVTEADNALADFLTDITESEQVPVRNVVGGTVMVSKKFADAAAAAVAERDGKHRHKFVTNDMTGLQLCAVCSKPKSSNGRKAASQPAAPTAEERTLALPVPPLGDAAADRFSDGSHGSSGVVRR